MNVQLTERPNWQAQWIIPKYHTPNDEIVRGLRTPGVDIFPFAVGQIGPFPPGNLLLQTGITGMWALVTGSSGATAWNNANTQIGVGTSTAAAAATQTGLLGSGAGTDYQTMDTGFPTYTTTGTAQWRSTFGTAKGNFSWDEFVLMNGNPGSGVAMNRRVSAQGTKLSTQTWVPTLQVVLS